MQLKPITRPLNLLGRVLLPCALLLLPLSSPAETDGESGRLTVVVSNVASDEGMLAIALFESQELYDASDPRPEDIRSEFVAIEGKRATFTFENVPFGDYALRIFHDENGNKELDTNWVGFPKEGFGFSNDAMGRMGPPSFDEARFRFEKDGQVATVHMK